MIGVAVCCAVAVLGGLPGEEAYLAANAAERAGRFGQAIGLYESCAKNSDALRPYALIRASHCASEMGKNEGAARAYRKIIEKEVPGPWTRMAQAYLAKLLHAQKDHQGAAAFYGQALNVAPQPWWMDDYAWPAAENLLAQAETRHAGYDWFRAYTDRDGYIRKRKEAALVLFKSPRPEDQAVAFLGLVRSGDYREAGKALLKSAVRVLGGKGEGIGLKDLSKTIFGNGMPPQEDLDKLAQANDGNEWVRLWLIFSLRNRATSRRFDEAVAVSEILATRFPGIRETGEGLWWLGQYLEREDHPGRAIERYTRLLACCPDHYRADDAAYRIGALHLAKGHVKNAEKAFELLGKTYPTSAFSAQGFFRCAEQREEDKDLKGARLYRAYAINTGPGNYYAHRALAKLCGDALPENSPLVNLKIDGTNPVLLPFFKHRDSPRPVPQPVLAGVRAQRLQFFGAHGLEAGQWEALDLCQNLANNPNATHWYRVLAETGFGHTALRYAAAAGWQQSEGPRSPELLRLKFPRAYWPAMTTLGKATGVDPYLLLAASKQESTFRATIRSHAGATGVMQLMPGTARWLAKVEPAVTQKHVANLTSPQNSIRMGAYYMMRMVERSGGNLVYALASYNAGPGNCDKWRKRFPNHSTEQFIEAIPFSETRHYVKKVLGNYAAYHSLYPPSP